MESFCSVLSIRKSLCVISLVLFLIFSSPVFAKTKGDPLEKYNRAMFSFNQHFDKYLLKPGSQVYKHLLPWPVRDGIRNAFDNLNMVPTIANDILQFHLYQTISDIWRLAVNSTIGIGGFFDVASRIGLKKNTEDFGLTLARWGYRESSYFVIPIIGPSTIRDAVALPINFTLFTVWPYVKPFYLRASILAGNVVSQRAELLKFDDIMLRAALDPYAFEKNAYLQRRHYLIERNNHPEQPYVAAKHKNVEF